ncbi:Universal stress protein A-like protein [Drosera capensis]
MADSGSSSSSKKVLLAIDDSECSHYALEWALENVHNKIASSGLVLFHAISNDYSGVYAGTYGGAPPELINSIQENQKKFGNALLEKAKQISAKHGIEAETVIEIGTPKEVICEAAEKLGIGLLIVGSHSRGAFQRAFLGSVSNYVVHNAKCPVLVVRK